MKMNAYTKTHNIINVLVNVYVKSITKFASGIQSCIRCYLVPGTVARLGVARLLCKIFYGISGSSTGIKILF